MRGELKKWGGSLLQMADGLSHGALRISIQALLSFNEARASEAAAAIAYYALFSLFPLLIILVVVSSSLLQSQDVKDQILNMVGEVLPPGEELARENMQRLLELGGLLPAQEILKENVQQVLDLRIPVGIGAAFGLLWASTSVFTALARNINRAWQGRSQRNFLKWRLIGLAMTGSLLTGLLILSLVFSSLLGLISQFQGGGFPLSEIWYLKLLSNLIPILLVFLTATVLYLWAPDDEVRWPEAGWGALVATSCWAVSKVGFSWYIESGLARHQLVYGSLGTVVVLMLWVYLSGMIILYGAHLSAAIGRRRLAEEER
ncbi:YihY/virulence factor BrkB family protein [Methanocrinis sp.]|uniref:YihY/virulence factor BrkB family protein n=1 Tax=Methanocrinis sp. TaxID=3101522 RepID=UPI003D0C0701